MMAALGGLDPGRRRIWLAAGVAALALLVLAGSWWRLNAEKARLESAVAEQMRQLEWMRAAAREVAGLRAAGPSEAPAGQQPSLTGALSSSIKTFALEAAVKQMQPDGQTSVDVWMEAVDFDRMIEWLHLLSGEHRVQVAELAAQRATAPGLVNARLRLAAGGG
jgi:general secretion pathway protein M